MRRFLRRGLSSLLALIMIAAALPGVSASAEDETYSTVIFDVTPESAVVEVSDSLENLQTAEEDGTYLLEDGATYTYTVSADGYASKTGSFTVEGDETIVVSLDELFEITFDITPDAAEIEVRDEFDALKSPSPDDSKLYCLTAGIYTYSVSADGYVTKSGELTVTQAETVTVELEPAPVFASFDINLPDSLIWTFDLSSDNYQNGQAQEGDAVTVEITRSPDAAATTFLGGIAVVDDTDAPVDVLTIEENEELSYGKYTFTMPGSDVTLSVNESYSSLNIRLKQTYDDGTSTEALITSYTRDELMTLKADGTKYYSGYLSTSEAYVAKSDAAVMLDALLENARSDMLMKSGDTLHIKTADGTTRSYTYGSLYLTRYYYPNLVSGSTPANKTRSAEVIKPMLVIRDFQLTTGSYEADPGKGLGSYTCNTLGAYKLVFGQSMEDVISGNPANEYADEKKILNGVTEITLERKYSDPNAGLENWQNKDSDGFVNIIDPSKISANSAQMAASPVWNGAIDVSWFEPGASVYYISTPAQLAGLAALVNGLHNETTYYVGNTDYIRVKLEYNDNADGDKGNNLSTADYYYGKYDFKGKTVYLTTNLDMGGGAQNYMPIGGQYLMIKNDSTTKLSSSFCGVFDGQGHTVSNIYCDRHCSTGNYGDGSSVGFIGRLGVHDNDPASWRPYEPAVRNLAVDGYIFGNRSVGGIVGKIGKNQITNMATGAGGAIIENCANFATVENTDAKGCGGIVGAGWNGGVVKNCYNAGTVKSSYNCPTGGISGSNEIVVYNCYSTGKISARSDSYAMAIGTNNGGGTNVDKCYWLQGSAPGGGYFGANSGEVLEKTEAYMKSEAFVKLLNENAGGEVFVPDYEESSKQLNNGFPLLKWQAEDNKAEEEEQETDEIETSSEASVVDGVGTVDLDDDYITEIIEDLAAAEKTTWNLNIDTHGENINAAVLKLSAQSAALLVKNGTTLIITSEIATVTLTSGILEQICAAAGGDETISIMSERYENNEYSFTLSAGDTVINEINGGFAVKVLVEADAGTVAAVIDSDGNAEVIKKSVADEASIRMRLEGSCRIRIFDNSKEYMDVEEGLWFADTVAFASSHELFLGTSKTEFSPQGFMTRGMLVTVLHRLENEPVTDESSVFSDINGGEWYADAVLWAAGEKIVLGMSDSGFAAGDNITREQLAVIIYRYAKLMGIADSTDVDALDDYSDSDEISAWAKEALAWTAHTGVMSGKSLDKIAPSDSTTRAEVAAVMQRLTGLLI